MLLSAILSHPHESSTGHEGLCKGCNLQHMAYLPAGLVDLLPSVYESYVIRSMTALFLWPHGNLCRPTSCASFVWVFPYPTYILQFFSCYRLVFAPHA